MASLVAGWENFFVAEVGAAAALSGLIFVAVSINLTRILEIKHLPERASETLVVLLGVLAVASFGLVPGQGALALGLEVLVVGFLLWACTIRLQWRAFRDPTAARQWLVLRVLATQLASIPFLVAGVLLVTGCRMGLYWLVPGVIASFAAGMLNAWVLLVEIQR